MTTFRITLLSALVLALPLLLTACGSGKY